MIGRLFHLGHSYRIPYVCGARGAGLVKQTQVSVCRSRRRNRLQVWRDSSQVLLRNLGYILDEFM